ncbi:MAG: anthranilate phosphoribosyltransferase, partial [Desulfobulbaceae bacterium]|nr:anthranilate phosphoribosyltransferase [Desulfobulbaceae bacterium]
DEMTVTGATHIADGHDGKVEEMILQPEDVGLKRATMADIRGGASAAESAEQVRAVLRGEPGARLDMVLLNSGTALMAADKATDIKGGIALARELIDSGAAMAKLDALVQFSQNCS